MVPAIYEDKFSNGIKVFGTESRELPIVSLYLTIKGGNMAMNDLSKTGLASLTATMMNEATQNYTSEQFDGEMSKMGSSISVSADDENTYVSVTTQKKTSTKRWLCWKRNC